MPRGDAIVNNDRMTVSMYRMTPNVRDQRRRVVGAPLADSNLSSPRPVRASGVTTRDDRCIA
jgi:hypothetical protein